MENAEYNEHYVNAYLDEAGKAFLRLSAHGTRPQMRTAGLFEFMLRDTKEAYGYNEGQSPRTTNSSRQTTQMEIVQEWVLNVPEVKHRRVMLMRMLICPRTDKRHLSWKKIGHKMGVSDVTAKAWYKAGVQNIVGKLNRSELVGW